MKLLRSLKDGLQRIIKYAGNWQVVILCFLGASTFWVFNALNKTYTASLAFPVKFDFNPNNLIVVTPLPQEIEINVTGGGWDLTKKTNFIKSSPLIIPLEDPVNETKIPGNQLANLLSNQLGTGIDLNYVVTDTIYTDIQPLVSRVMKLNLDSSKLRVGEEYKITAAVKVNPDTARISGPQSVMDTLGDRLMIPYNEAISGSVDQDVSIPLPYPQWMKVEPRQTHIRISASRLKTVESDFVAEPLNFPEDSAVYLLDNEVRLRYRIPENSDPPLDSFHIVADYSRMTWVDSTILPIVIHHPDHVYDVELLTDRLKVGHE